MSFKNGVLEASWLDFGGPRGRFWRFGARFWRPWTSIWKGLGKCLLIFSRILECFFELVPIWIPLVINSAKSAKIVKTQVLSQRAGHKVPVPRMPKMPPIKRHKFYSITKGKAQSARCLKYPKKQVLSQWAGQKVPDAKNAKNANNAYREKFYHNGQGTECQMPKMPRMPRMSKIPEDTSSITKGQGTKCQKSKITKTCSHQMFC